VSLVCAKSDRGSSWSGIDPTSSRGSLGTSPLDWAKAGLQQPATTAKTTTVAMFIGFLHRWINNTPIYRALNSAIARSRVTAIMRALARGENGAALHRASITKLGAQPN
jgi:hypothetical protein